MLRQRSHRSNGSFCQRLPAQAGEPPLLTTPAWKAALALTHQAAGRRGLTNRYSFEGVICQQNDILSKICVIVRVGQQTIRLYANDRLHKSGGWKKVDVTFSVSPRKCVGNWTGLQVKGGAGVWWLGRIG
jgi:hypothetical protein